MTLGIALGLLFAGASPSNMLNQIQHTAGITIDHEHLLFSGLTAEPDHIDDDSRSGDEERETGRALQGHHHHHGDTGSAIPLDASNKSLIMPVRSHPHHMGPNGQKPGSGTAGLERPPRNAAINA